MLSVVFLGDERGNVRLGPSEPRLEVTRDEKVWECAIGMPDGRWNGHEDEDDVNDQSDDEEEADSLEGTNVDIGNDGTNNGRSVRQ